MKGDEQETSWKRQSLWLLDGWNIANVWNNVWYFIEVNKTEGYIRHEKQA